MNSVNDFVGVDEDDHARGGFAVAVHSEDGNTRRVIFGGSRAQCEAMADAIAETLATWDGWSGA